MTTARMLRSVVGQDGWDVSPGPPGSLLLRRRGMSTPLELVAGDGDLPRAVRAFAREVGISESAAREEVLEKICQDLERAVPEQGPFGLDRHGQLTASNPDPFHDPLRDIGEDDESPDGRGG